VLSLVNSALTSAGVNARMGIDIWHGAVMKSSTSSSVCPRSALNTSARCVAKTLVLSLSKCAHSLFCLRSGGTGVWERFSCFVAFHSVLSVGDRCVMLCSKLLLRNSWRAFFRCLDSLLYWCWSFA